MKVWCNFDLDLWSISTKFCLQGLKCLDSISTKNKFEQKYESLAQILAWTCQFKKMQLLANTLKPCAISDLGIAAPGVNFNKNNCELLVENLAQAWLVVSMNLQSISTKYNCQQIAQSHVQFKVIVKVLIAVKENSNNIYKELQKLGWGGWVCKSVFKYCVT